MTHESHSDKQAPVKTDVIGFLARFAPLIFLIVLMAAFAISEPRFLTPLNLFNILRQVSIYGLLAVGMTFVILTAGIDLSIGSLVAFAGLVAAAVSKGGLSNRFNVGHVEAARRAGASPRPA
jgi:ribose/xylose/arabinose/galactoside ABC-type transport system permease subunit